MSFRYPKPPTFPSASAASVAVTPLGYSERSSAANRKREGIIWLLAALLAIGFGAAASAPKIALAVVALLFFGILGGWMLRRPINPFLAALVFYPFYPMLRATIRVYQLPIPLAAAGMWPELVLCLMLLTIVVRCCRSGERLRLTWLDLPVVAMVAGAVYAIFLALMQRQLGAAFYGVHYSLTAMLFYFAARWAKANDKDLRSVVLIFVLSYIALGLPSLYDYFHRSDFVVRLAKEVRPLIAGPWDQDLFWRVYPRMQSLIFDENLWGAFCANIAFVSLAVMVCPIPRAEGGARPLFRGAFFLFTFATLCLYLSMSRGGVACYLIGIVAITVCAGRYRVRLLGIGAAIIAALVLLLIVYPNHPRIAGAMKRYTSVSDTSSKVAYDRVEMWENAIVSFWGTPSGSGLGTAGQAAVYHGGGAVVTDGQYFKVLVEEGIPGVFTWVVGWIGAIGIIVGLLRGAYGIDRIYGLTVLASIIGQLAQNVGSNASDFYYMPVITWAFLGFFVARRTQPPIGRTAEGTRE